MRHFLNLEIENNQRAHWVSTIHFWAMMVLARQIGASGAKNLVEVIVKAIYL